MSKAAVKRKECAKCHVALVQPRAGRPRVYCGPACRRSAEYELRRLQAALTYSARRLVNAKAAAVNAADPMAAARLVEFWADEWCQDEVFLDEALSAAAEDRAAQGEEPIATDRKDAV